MCLLKVRITCLLRAEGENPVLPRAPASASPTSEPEEQYEEEEQEEQCKCFFINTCPGNASGIYMCHGVLIYCMTILGAKILILVNADDTVPSPGSLLGRGVGGSQV